MNGPLVQRPQAIRFKMPWLLQAMSLIVIGLANLPQGRSLDLSYTAIGIGVAMVLGSLLWRKTLTVDAGHLSLGLTPPTPWPPARMTGDKLGVDGRHVDLSGAIWPSDPNLAAWRGKQAAESLGLAYRAPGLQGQVFQYSAKPRIVVGPILLGLVLLIFSLAAPNGWKLPVALSAFLWPIFVAIWNLRKSPRDLEIRHTSPSTALIRHKGVEHAATIERTIGGVDSWDFLGFREVWLTQDRRFAIDPRALEPKLDA